MGGEKASSNIFQKKKAKEILLAIAMEPRSIRKIREAVLGSYSTILTRLKEFEQLGLIKLTTKDGVQVYELTGKGELAVKSLTGYSEVLLNPPEPEKTKGPKFVLKRDAKIEPFDQKRILASIQRAAKAVGSRDAELPAKLTAQTIDQLEKIFGKDGVPTVEEIQDMVEKALIEDGFAAVARAYVLYQTQHADMRELVALLSSADLVDQYLEINDNFGKENIISSYSLSGLNNYLSSTVIAKYWVCRVYPEKVVNAHFYGDLHIHALGILGPDALSWNIRDILISGFGGFLGRIEVGPPKHFQSALDRLVNFFMNMREEAGGAQGLSHFDTYLAPFIRYDCLTQREVEDNIRSFLNSLNVQTRGFHPPFSCLNMDLEIPEFLKRQNVVFNGNTCNDTYDDFSKEMEMFNLAFAKIMAQGDLRGRPFAFPIPTYKITPDFNWGSSVSKGLFDVASKYGTPYFGNFLGSNSNPEDVTNLFRLSFDNKKLRKCLNGAPDDNPVTGSVGVVTLNFPRIGYLAKDEDEYFERLESLMELAKSSLEIKRGLLEKLMSDGLHPYCKRYLHFMKKDSGEFLSNHFSTIGVVGLNESVLNLFGENIASPDGRAFAIKVLKFMRKLLVDYQKETKHLFNLQATPAEGVSYRLARMDQRRYRDIVFANQRQVAHRDSEPFYTNSSQLPVDFTDNLFAALKHQEDLQNLYTGGTVFDIFLKERFDTWESAAELLRSVCEKTNLPLFTLTPTFSICKNHGYLSGKQVSCPLCGSLCEIYSKVAGYLRPVNEWNAGKQAEFGLRTYFKLANT